jgi:hypothetical protein
VREEYLLPPVTDAVPQLETPMTRGPSRFSSTSSEGASSALPGYLPGVPPDHHQLTIPQACVPWQSPVRAGDGVGTYRAVTDKPRGRRRRRRSSPRDGRSEDAGKQERFSAEGIIKAYRTRLHDV